MDERSRTPLRLLAPAALACFALALLVVIATADVSGGGSSTDAQRAEQRDLGGEERSARSERDSREEEEEDAGLPDDVYVVKQGDTLGAISERVGISVERLQQLNPELDPQALVSGQQIKLRE